VTALDHEATVDVRTGDRAREDVVSPQSITACSGCRGIAGVRLGPAGSVNVARLQAGGGALAVLTVKPPVASTAGSATVTGLPMPALPALKSA